MSIITSAGGCVEISVHKQATYLCVAGLEEFGRPYDAILEVDRSDLMSIQDLIFQALKEMR